MRGRRQDRFLILQNCPVFHSETRITNPKPMVNIYNLLDNKIFPKNPIIGVSGDTTCRTTRLHGDSVCSGKIRGKARKHLINWKNSKSVYMHSIWEQPKHVHIIVRSTMSLRSLTVLEQFGPSLNANQKLCPSQDKTLHWRKTAKSRFQLSRQGQDGQWEKRYR